MPAFQTPQALRRMHANTTQLSLDVDSVSSINALPIEILTKIFVCCLDDSAFRVPAAKQAPLLLCGICCLWRSIAISTPGFWCSMKIASTVSPDFIDTWLSRAKGNPLSIAFTLDSGSPLANLPFRPKHTRRYLDAIMAHSDHWQSLEIMIFPDAPLGLLNKLSKVPRLERLILRYPHGTRMCGRSPLDYIFRSSSHLRQVFIFGDDKTISMPLLWHLPSSNLKTLCTDSLLHPDECLGFLSRSRELEQGYFRLAYWTLQTPLWTSSNPIMLKNMQILSLQTTTTLTDLFINLALPALRILRIGYSGLDSWSHRAFLSFISPFSSQLETLRLDRPPVLEAQLIEYLRFLPSLTELALKDRPNFPMIGNELMCSLTYHIGDDGGSATYLCPKLTELALFGANDCTDERLVDMLNSRWQLAPTLQKSDDTVVSISPVIHSSLPLQKESHD